MRVPAIRRRWWAAVPFLNEKEDWLRSPRQTIHFELRRTDLPVRWHDCRDSLVFPAGGQWRQFILYLMPPEQNLPPSITKLVNAVRRRRR